MLTYCTVKENTGESELDVKSPELAQEESKKHILAAANKHVTFSENTPTHTQIQTHTYIQNSPP